MVRNMALNLSQIDHFGQLEEYLFTRADRFICGTGYRPRLG
jgi:hypothetical protein